MSNLENLKDIPSVTSSLGLEDGVTPSGLLDGPMTDLSGPDHVPANLSPRQAKERDLLMSGIYGHYGIGSSNNADLQSSLASRLQQQSLKDGSTLFAMTWKVLVTPAGRQICQLQALGLRIGGREYSGLPTPQAIDSKGTCAKLVHKKFKVGHLKHWIHGTALGIHSSSGKSSWPNPNLVEWLMGYPRLWISGHDYTPTEMR